MKTRINRPRARANGILELVFWLHKFLPRGSSHRMIKTSDRLVYLDWLRGLGVLIMLQGHVIDAWVRPQDRSGEWFWLSQFLGGLPAPIFLFLVGVSLALVLDRMRAKGATYGALAS